MKKYYKNVINNEILDILEMDYYGIKNYETSNMNKASPYNVLKYILPELHKIIGKDWKVCASNYYRHSKPYLPHTDYRESWGESINVVIPISFESSQIPKLIVFDQKYLKDSVTWAFDLDVKFEINKEVKGRPCDDPNVLNLTGLDLSNDVYKFLTWRPKNDWFGLSGDIFDFTPGNIMVFDSTYIHATGDLHHKKLGLTIRFNRSH